MNELLLIIGMTLVTFGIRYPVLAVFGRIKLPERILQALRFVPPAVLTAIIVPEMLLRDGQFAPGPGNPYLIGGIAAGVVAWRTKNLLLTIVVGMAAFWLWRGMMQ